MMDQQPGRLKNNISPNRCINDWQIIRLFFIPPPPWMMRHMRTIIDFSMCRYTYLDLHIALVCSYPFLVGLMLYYSDSIFLILCSPARNTCMGVCCWADTRRLFSRVLRSFPRKIPSEYAQLGKPAQNASYFPLVKLIFFVWGRRYTQLYTYP
jgi:hypothetical protein